MVSTELALFFRYLVFSDPPGAKIGCGGATMYVLEALEEAIPKEELEKGMVMKVVEHMQSTVCVSTRWYLAGSTTFALCILDFCID